jgi:hypothetical protein
MAHGAENSTYELVQGMISGRRCGMCGRSDMRRVDYVVRDGRIVDVPRRQTPQLCTLCDSEWRSYQRSATPAVLRDTSSAVLADALAAIVRPDSFTLPGYATVTPEQWHALACGYMIVRELRRRADDCTRRMNAASRDRFTLGWVPK